MSSSRSATQSVEEELIRAFVRPDKQERFLGFVANEKRRAKFTNELRHARCFDPAFIVEIAPAAQYPEEMAALLTEHGASETCYVISAEKRLDRQMMSLRAVLRSIVGGSSEGTLLSCVPGRLAYYDGEAPKDRYLLVR